MVLKDEPIIEAVKVAAENALIVQKKYEVQGDIRITISINDLLDPTYNMVAWCMDVPKQLVERKEEVGS